MHLPKFVKLVEVGPRDGLQNEPTNVSAAIRVELIDRLSRTGLTVIEAGAFVSRNWVPQMADTDKVLASISRAQGVHYPVLVPNLRGFEAADKAGAHDIAVFTAASETFSRKNTNCSIRESFERFAPVCAKAKEKGIRVRGYVSCALWCPYEGRIEPGAVVPVVERLLRLGCEEISLGDTIGKGTPIEVQHLIDAVAAVVSCQRLAVHFHDTYGQALANVLAALEKGVAIVDGSVAGLGGCPYAPGASGNLASEDVLYMLNGMGIETGVDLEKLLDAGHFISRALARPPASRVSRALARPEEENEEEEVTLEPQTQ